MKKHLLFLFAALLPLIASAQLEVQLDGIRYNLVTKGKVARVISGGAYYGSITIPATITYENVEYSVTSIEDRAFSECSSLTSITLPESVTSIGADAFFQCSSLAYINIPKGVTEINCGAGGAFWGCSSLTAITLPEGLTSIGREAFLDCSSLKSITIPKAVTSIGEGAFSGCSSLTVIAVDEDNAVYDSRNNCNAIIATSNDSLITGCAKTIIPKGVKSIGDDAFSGCTSLTAITIPEGVTSIGASAFSGCTSLAAITIPEDSKLTSIGKWAFRGCSSLTAITIPEGVTSIGEYAFSSCSSLKSITILEGVTTIGEGAFSECDSLTAIVLPKSLSSIGYSAFARCSELLDVYCYAENVPKTVGNAFGGSYPEYATLHVPANAINSYKATAPWSNFGTIVNLGAAITRITIDKLSATLTEGNTLELTTTTNPENADRNLISWSSSNPSVATVDNTGKVTAIAPGTATITATANDGSGVSASCEVTVTPASYVIKFLIDGGVFLMDTLTRGSTITLPKEEPTKEGYTFSGWDEVPETMPAEDLIIEGTFIVNKYLVTFKIGDEVIASDSLEYGATIVAPEAPAKEGYAFAGWGEVDATVPAHNVTYEGSYSVNSYILTYIVDGEKYHQESIKYGTAIEAIKEPTKEGYTFSGWSEAPETMPANDVTIEGTFIVNKYLVTFKIDDEVVASESLEYGANIVAPEAPEKVGYTFNGWGEVAETVPAYDVTFEGSYSINSYTLTYVVDGEAVLTFPILYGGSIPSLKVPAKEGYTFSGWSEIPDAMPAEDVTIEGTFTQLPSVSLTINQADNGYVKQHLTEGTVCSFTIVAAEGWKIHSVTFNGKDVTTQLTAEGIYTTPTLSEDAVLNIAYEEIRDNAIDNASASRIKVQGHQGTLRITGTTEGDDISVYTTDGMLVAQESAECSETTLTLPTSEVYIVKVADKVVKIGM